MDNNGEDNLRFVLTWNERPQDLSMHLLLERPTKDNDKKTWEEVTSEQTTNHVANFKERIYNGHGYKIVSQGVGSLQKHPYASTTHNEKEGWGPDELFVKRILPAAYTLYVQRVGDQVTSLQESGARVLVYQNTELVDEIVVPSNGESMTKDFWNVLQFKGLELSSPDHGSSFDTRKVVNTIARREPPQDAYA